MVFDLEKARKIVGAMSPTPWIVLEDRYGQIDVIRNPNHPMHKEGVIELWGMTSETATPDAIGISYMRSEFPNALDEIERLRGEMENYGDDYVCQMKSKDVRIQELEDALVEMVATNPCNIPTLCDVVHDELMCLALDGNCDFWKGCPQKNELRKAARKQLQAEGKIGRGDA